MTTIRLLDARRGLNLKCRELFKDDKIAEAIYRYLCDGIEECEDAEPEQKTGKWIKMGRWGRVYKCNKCGNLLDFDGVNVGRGSTNFCPNCGERMEDNDE